MCRGGVALLLAPLAALAAAEAMAWRLGAGTTAHPELPQLSIGLIVPHTNFGVREYTRAINTAVAGMHKSRGPKYNFLKRFTFTPHQVRMVMMQLTPTPTVMCRGGVALLLAPLAALAAAEAMAWRLGAGTTAHHELPQLSIGLIVPHTNFGVREYTRAINTAVAGMHKSRGPKYNFLKRFTFTPHQVRMVMMQLTPTPTVMCRGGVALLLAPLAALAAAEAMAWRLGAGTTAHPELPQLSIGLIVPHTNFGVREYTRAINTAVAGMHKSRGPKYNFLKRFTFTPHQVRMVMMQLTPTPTVMCRGGVALLLAPLAALAAAEAMAWRLGAGTTAHPELPQLSIGLIVPHTNFGVREYTRAINTAVAGMHKSRGPKYNFLKRFTFTPHQVRMVMMQLTPTPTAILKSLCEDFLSVNVSAILYLMNYEQYGRSTASAQYFLQLAGYLGIPVIAWNADNSGLERRASQSSLQLQLAPSLDHQTAAMLSILERYKWHQFSVVTSQIAGHDDFIQAVREKVSDMQDRFKFTILNAILVTKPGDLVELVDSEARVMLLYCTREEAIDILTRARDLKLTGENYVWVVTQSVIENLQTPSQFPVGMLGVHFDTSSASLVNEITTAIKVYAYGVEDYTSDPRNAGRSLNTQLSCEGAGAARWDTGDRFFRYLRNVSVEADAGKPNVEFNQDGVLRATELKIMNLRPGVSKQLVWEEVGVWKSWQKEGLDIKDIVWPGNSHTPPQGVPEKFHLKITFLEEPPYINLAPPDPITGKCSMDRGVLCRVASDADITEVDMSQAHRNGSFYQCCSGFCIDLLEKFSEELGFTYELVRVEDGRWGTLTEHGKWNGLIADLVNRKTDMVMTSLMINSEREAVVDFSVPYMETGIAIVVAKRTGIISPTAFLEPFDTASWMLVGVVAIQAATFTIFLFEWLSPSGFNMKLSLQQIAPTSTTSHRFSLFRTYWLVWAVLFQAAVHVDSPRGFTARFMTNVWAMFAVVFLAIYTANLAAFMITREEFHEFSGVDDHRLSKPYSHKPMYKFGTIPWSHTDSTIAKYFKEMHSYMRIYNKSTVVGGIEAVLSGDLDAFIYDGTVLDYLVAQDEDCRLLTVGSWYAMTGYGLAFSRNSKYLEMFNKRLLDFRENGDLERLRRYWMTGTCKPGKQEHKSSDPLALEQFLSAFLLLMAGILLATLLLFLEHLYFKYVRKHLAKSDRGGCCALVSLSMGKSLTFRGAVFEAQDILKHHRCRDPICDTHLWKVKHELDMSQMRVKQLEKELESNGIKPPPKRRGRQGVLCLASCMDCASDAAEASTATEMAKARLRGINADFADSTSNIYRPCRTEIAEMETVL